MTHSVSVHLDEYMYIEGMGHQEDGHPHLEEILEETEADPVMQVVLFGDRGFFLSIISFIANPNLCIPEMKQATGWRLQMLKYPLSKLPQKEEEEKE